MSSLIAYCGLTRASVTSYGRTAERNRKVGGVPHSAHLVWLGADVVYDEPPEAPWRRDMARRLGLRLLVESDHDHLQPDDWERG